MCFALAAFCVIKGGLGGGGGHWTTRRHDEYNVHKNQKHGNTIIANKYQRNNIRFMNNNFSSYLSIISPYLNDFLFIFACIFFSFLYPPIFILFVLFNIFYFWFFLKFQRYFHEFVNFSWYFTCFFWYFLHLISYFNI